MFRYTELRSIGDSGDNEVLTKDGKVVGAILRKAGTEKEWEESGGGLPYEVYRNGKLIAVRHTLPTAQKVLDDFVKPKA
jgi:hypothetical protein